MLAEQSFAKNLAGFHSHAPAGIRWAVGGRARAEVRHTLWQGAAGCAGSARTALARSAAGCGAADAGSRGTGPCAARTPGCPAPG